MKKTFKLLRIQFPQGQSVTIDLLCLFFCLLFLSLLSSNAIAATRYVKPIAAGSGNGSSWANASNDLQAMINASSAGDEVWVAGGIYYPQYEPDGTTNAPRDFTFKLKDSVKVYGSFAGNEINLSDRNLSLQSSILDGDIGTLGVVTDNAYHVVLSVSDNNTTLLDGFVIRNGRANTATNLSVETKSTARSEGGGIYNAFSNTIYQNIALVNNFSSDDGGGLYNNSSSPKVINAIFYNNDTNDEGGGVFNESGSYPEFINCIFVENDCARSGGAIFGVFNNDPTQATVVRNCIFRDNRINGVKTTKFADLGAFASFFKVENSALQFAFNNTNYETAEFLNDISAANNFFNYDPAFQNISDPDGVDDRWFSTDDGLLMKSCSQLVNAGENTFNNLSKDIQNNIRIFESTIDMGPYEIQETADPVLITSLALDTICSNVFQKYAISCSHASPTYNWSRAAVSGISNAAVSNQSSDTIKEKLINTTQNQVNAIYKINATANACKGPTYTRTLTVDPNPNASILNVTMDSAFVNKPYLDTLKQSGMTTPKWSVILDSIPQGLVLNSSNGIINGTPTQVGSYNMPVTVQQASCSVSKSIPLKVYETMTVVEINNINIGNKNASDTSFWRSVGLTANIDADGLPDSTDQIKIMGNSTGQITLDKNLTIQSLVIDSVADVTLKLGNKILSIIGGELKSLKAGTLKADSATIKFYRNAIINIKDIIGTLEMETDDTGKILLYNHLLVKTLLKIKKMNKLEGGKEIQLEGDAELNNPPMRGDGKIKMQGSQDQKIKGDGSVHNLVVDKPSGNIELENNLRIKNADPNEKAQLKGNNTPIRSKNGSAVSLEDEKEVEVDYQGKMDRVEAKTPKLMMKQDLNVDSLLVLHEELLEMDAPAGTKLNNKGNLVVNTQNLKGPAFVVMKGDSLQIISGPGALHRLEVNKPEGSYMRLDDYLRIKNADPNEKAQLKGNNTPIRSENGSAVSLEDEKEVEVDYQGKMDRVEAKTPKLMMKQDLNVDSLLVLHEELLEMDAPAGTKLNNKGNLVVNTQNLKGPAFVVMKGDSLQIISGPGALHRLEVNKPEGSYMRLDDYLRIKNADPNEKAQLKGNNTPIRSENGSAVSLEDAKEVEVDYQGKMDRVEAKTPKLMMKQDLNVDSLLVLHEELLEMDAPAGTKLNNKGNLVVNTQNLKGPAFVVMKGDSLQIISGPGALHRLEVNKPEGSYMRLDDYLRIKNADPNEKAQLKGNNTPIRSENGSAVSLEDAKEVEVDYQGKMDRVEAKTPKLMMKQDLNVDSLLVLHEELLEMDAPVGTKLNNKGNLVVNTQNLKGPAFVVMKGDSLQIISGPGALHRLEVNKPEGSYMRLDDYLRIKNADPYEKAELKGNNTAIKTENGSAVSLEDEKEVIVDYGGDIDKIQITTPKLNVKQDLHIEKDLNYSGDTVELIGKDKAIKVKGDYYSDAHIKGDSKTEITGKQKSQITANPMKSQGHLKVNKEDSAKTELMSDLLADTLFVESGILDLGPYNGDPQMQRKVTANTTVQGKGKMAGSGKVKKPEPSPNVPPPPSCIKGYVYNSKTKSCDPAIGTNSPSPNSPGIESCDALKSTDKVAYEQCRKKYGVAPGNSPGQIEFDYPVAFKNTNLDFELTAMDAGSGYDQVSINGQITIDTGVSVTLFGANINCYEFIILKNNSSDSIKGRFVDLPNSGDTISFNGLTYAINYKGGDGNDISFTLQDTVKPFVSCPSSVVKYTTSNQCFYQTQNTEFDFISSSDNCGVTSIDFSLSGATIGTGLICLQDTVFNVGETTIQWMAKDAFQNTAICQFILTVQDTFKPLAVCSDFEIYLNNSGEFELQAENINNNSSDACGVLSINLNKSGFTCEDVGSESIILTVTDVHSNFSTCSASVIIYDTIKPQAICKNANVYLNSIGTVDISPSQLDNNSSDACGLDDLDLSIDQLFCNHTGVVEIVLYVTDMNGNSSSCVSLLTVLDTILPIITCPQNQIRNTATGLCSYTANGLEFNTSFQDNCTKKSESCILSGANTGSQSGSLAGKILSKGITTVLWTVTASNNQSGTCSFTINVQDLEKPTITCPADMTVTTPSGQCKIDKALVNLGIPTASDNCGINGPHTNNAPNQFELGVQTVKWTTKDSSNNKNNCNQKLTVLAYSCGAPVTVFVKDTTETSAKIKWSAGTPCNTDYQLRIRHEISSGVWSSWSTWASSNGNSKEYHYTNLLSGKLHHYQIRSKCGSASTSSTIDGWFTTKSNNALRNGVLNKNEFFGSLEFVDVQRTETSISDLSMNISPNPTHDFFKLQIKGFESVPKSLMLTDIFGRIVKQIKLEAAENELHFENQHLQLRNGVYILHISDGKNSIMKRLEVVH